MKQFRKRPQNSKYHNYNYNYHKYFLQVMVIFLHVHFVGLCNTSYYAETFKCLMCLILQTRQPSSKLSPASSTNQYSLTPKQWQTWKLVQRLQLQPAFRPKTKLKKIHQKKKRNRQKIKAQNSSMNKAQQKGCCLQECSQSSRPSSRSRPI